MMMRTIEVAPAIWSEYFATVAAEDAGSFAQVRVLLSDTRRAARGAAIERPLRGISFDGARHVIELSVGGASADRPAVRYFVGDPQRVVAVEAADLLEILILDANGLRTLVRLARRPNASLDRIQRRSPALGSSTRNAMRGRGAPALHGRSRAPFTHAARWPSCR